MPSDRGAHPLVSRGPAEVIYRRGGQAVTVAEFLADVAALAARLPAEGPALNLCTDRYLALLGFAAALCRGHVTLLSADRTPRRLQELAAQQAPAYALAEDAAGLAVPTLRPEPLGAAPDAPNPLIPADRLAAIAFTSGTTGAPTPHDKPWGALVACARAAARRFALGPGDGPPATILGTVPPQHMYGFETTIVLPLHAAAAGHAGDSFFPLDIAEALHRIPERRILVTTPLQLRAQLASEATMPPLAAVISATAPLSASLAHECEWAWGTEVLEIYGATEAGSLASRRTVTDMDWLPYDGVRFDIQDLAAVVEVPGLPHAVPLADQIAAGENGRFRLLGRRADIVKLAGKRASLAGLNRILNEIEGVEDGVFLAPDDLEGNPAARLSAFVVAPARSAEQIVAALRDRVEAAFLPRPVVLVPALPRDAVGKLSRGALLALRNRAGA
jgi:acyl-coenzyme A synthetase/AMP-(fatty) acid ligase